MLLLAVNGNCYNKSVKKIALKIGYGALVIIYLSYIGVLVIFSQNFNIITSFINTSESMEPAIPLHAVVVIKEEDFYSIGDIISYYAKIDDEIVVVTHRIKDISGNMYLTKGDKNILEDRELVKPRLVIGRAFLIIPWIGNLLNFSKTASGLYLTILLPALIIITIELSKIFYFISRLPEKDSFREKS